MPSTWEILTVNSTLPVNGINTTWDHLNNQNGDGDGGGGFGIPTLVPVINTLRIIPTVNTITINATKLPMLAIKDSPRVLTIIAPKGGDINEIEIRQR